MTRIERCDDQCPMTRICSADGSFFLLFVATVHTTVQYLLQYHTFLREKCFSVGEGVASRWHEKARACEQMSQFPMIVVSKPTRYPYDNLLYTGV